MKRKISGAGTGSLVLIAIFFTVLKLTKLITWSWLWVLCPLWIPLAVVIVVAATIDIIEIFEKR
jgi:hypothetical protein